MCTPSTFKERIGKTAHHLVPGQVPVTAPGLKSGSVGELTLHALRHAGGRQRRRIRDSSLLHQTRWCQTNAMAKIVASRHVV